MYERPERKRIIPFHLTVGEPELKWCEAIIENLTALCPYPPNRNDYRGWLLLRTNLAENRIERALNILYAQKRI